MSSAQQPVPVLKLIHDTTKTAGDFAKYGRLGVQVLAGTQAFRTYDSLANTIGTNVAGNLRGMVISEKWRTVYKYVSKNPNDAEAIGSLNARAIGDFCLFASIAAGLVESAPNIDYIMESKDSNLSKTLQMTSLVGTLSQRALLGAIPSGVHLIYWSLEGWCMLAGLLPPLRAASANSVQVLQSADALVSTTFQHVTDSRVQGNAVWAIITIVNTAKQPPSSVFSNSPQLPLWIGKRL